MAIGVPVIIYGAVEFGWMHPIQTEELKEALHMMELVSTLSAIYLVGNLGFGQKIWHTDPKEDKSA